jgi:hypothetical protein
MLLIFGRAWLANYTVSLYCRILYTVRKGYRFSRPQPGCQKSCSPWQGIIKLFPARESLVIDMPAGDGENRESFLQCSHIRYCTLPKVMG